MKTQILERLPPDTQLDNATLKAALAAARNPRILGEVEPMPLSAIAGVWPVVESLVQRHRLHYTEPRLYLGRSLLRLVASTGWHDDSGMGHVLNWVLDVQHLNASFTDCSKHGSVHCTSDWEMMPTLCIHGKQLEVDVGDVFIFNADRPHAWLSNHCVTLAQVAVKPHRTRSK